MPHDEAPIEGPEERAIEGPDEGPDDRADGAPAGRRSTRDSWWFSPTLQVVAGGAVVGFQWGPISQGTANWANWLVGTAGMLVLLLGALALLRAFQQQR